jgi:hypothetical protein
MGVKRIKVLSAYKLIRSGNTKHKTRINLHHYPEAKAQKEK